ncbi:MAG: cytochrome c3 family protein [Desulfobacterota bacterium]|nr:cytochrome c3 family protein [Thermodesulfobacteriota bacterium]
MKRQLSVWWLMAAVLFVVGYGASALAGTREIDDCLACHDDHNLVKVDAAGKKHSLYVDRDAFMKSVHGKAGHTCGDCHEGVEAGSHPAGGIPDVSCGSCHSDIEQLYRASNHGKLLEAGNPYAPKCQDCHTAHSVLVSSDPQSSVHPDNLAKTCGVCHEEEAKQPLCSLALDFAKGKIGADQFSLTALLAPLATRVKGHGKVNLGCEYTTRQCSNCHFEVVKHAENENQPKVCSTCHESGTSGIVFGTIHRSGVLQKPILSIMLAFAYLVVIAGIIMYFKQGVVKGEVQGAETGEPQ